MIEFIKHFLGFCGEHWHPNLWTFLYTSPIIIYALYYLKWHFRKYLKKII
jgi:hypothetical protein